MKKKALYLISKAKLVLLSRLIYIKINFIFVILSQLEGASFEIWKTYDIGHNDQIYKVKNNFLRIICLNF